MTHLEKGPSLKFKISYLVSLAHPIYVGRGSSDGPVGVW